MDRHWLGSWAGVLGALAAAVMPLRAETVSIELRPAVQRVTIGTTITLGLYAVSDSGSNQSFSGLEALPAWVPGVLTLLGLTNNGPYPWLSSWFPPDGQLDGINDTWTDGTAYYQAFGRLAPAAPPQATAAGLLCTTLRFRADGPGTSAVYFMPEFGQYSFTRVLDAVNPGLFLTGTLRGATVIVVACGVPADMDADCDVDLADFDGFDLCLTGPGVAVAPGCLIYDLDDNNNVDLRDFAGLQQSFTGSVPP